MCHMIVVLILATCFDRTVEISSSHIRDPFLLYIYIYIITKIPFFLETYTQTTSKKEKINHYLLLGEYLPLSKAKPTNIRRLKNTFLLNARAYK
jgi:hypothetical protein